MKFCAGIKTKIYIFASDLEPC